MLPSVIGSIGSLMRVGAMRVAYDACRPLAIRSSSGASESFRRRVAPCRTVWAYHEAGARKQIIMTALAPA
jgi:hypothetical protein